MLKIFTPACLAIMLMTNSFADGEPAAGKEKTALCVACHGNEGVSTTPIWPNLAGQHAEYVRKQLHDFKDNKRSNPQMSPMATTLTDSDIEDLSAYYASLTAAAGEAAPENIVDGETIYRAGNPKTGLVACSACHGPGGAGNAAAKYPALSGQHAEYTVASLKAFKAEERANDDKNIMRIIAGKMTNQEIDAVANYIQGLY
ncbi:MAG: cytochrome C [Gammaproteobacteria bacterium RIFCSPLOWO2_12_FULL_52_10]|nr:MAG: cytochrome C [Gammaproteobacteria bacterium RIFCSPLOWO2_12_FULL_52_10]